MSDSQGLYAKYKIIKRSTNEEVTEGAFVLRPSRDPHALAALEAYAKSLSITNEDPRFAHQLYEWIRSIKGDNS